MNILTIFTPTYNREITLYTLYESLLLQSKKDFVWLIVDDGSTDHTRKTIKKWMNEKKINIRYFFQENQGKHIAYNKGLDECNTPLIFCVDSDDFLCSNAVEVIHELYMLETKNVLGFCMQKGDKKGLPTGINWPSHIEYCHLIELYQKCNFVGETAIIFKTNLIKNYKFPQFKGEKFITEIALFDQLNHIGPMRLDNRVLYCFEYRHDGYTEKGMKLYFDNPVGTAYTYLIHLRNSITFQEKVKSAAKFFAWKEITNIKVDEYFNISMPLYLWLLGIIFKGHYINLFNRIR